MNNPKPERDEGLVRVMGTGVVGINIVNMVVGAGIFALPGIVAAGLGSAAILAYVVCSVAVALVFLCFAEVGSRITRSGGAYAYIEDAFGPFAGFIASVLFWFGWAALSDAGMTIVMAKTLAIAFPVLEQPVPRALLIVVVLAFMAAVNIRGTRSGIRLFVFNTIAKLVPLMLLVIVGLFAVNIEYLKITQWPTLHSVGTGAVLLFFAFGGAETALNVSGEIKNPSRTVPLGLLFGLTALLALYIGLQTVAQGVLGPELANNTDAPLAAAASVVFGEWGAKMLLVGTVISIFACISGDMLNTPRLVFASALDGLMPRVLAKVHPKYKTPYVSIIFFATVIAITAISGTFKPVAVVASGSILTIYAGVSLAVIRLRQRDGLPGPGQFTLPFGPTIPILSFLFIGWLLFQLTKEEAITFGALVAVAMAIYAVRALLRGKSAG